MRPKHGLSKTPEFTIWWNMRRRCCSPKATCYERYGGRGIKLHPTWQKFAAFYADMGPRPHGTSLDRIDNDGNYEPKNCRWATPEQQQNNNSRNHRLTFNEVTMTVVQWARKLGKTPESLHARIRAGMTTGEVLFSGVYSCAPHIAKGGAANGKKQRAKTHCRKGHERTPGNILVLYDQAGRSHWHCNECARIRKRDWRAMRKAHNLPAT